MCVYIFIYIYIYVYIYVCIYIYIVAGVERLIFLKEEIGWYRLIYWPCKLHKISYNLFFII